MGACGFNTILTSLAILMAFCADKFASSFSPQLLLHAEGVGTSSLAYLIQSCLPSLVAASLPANAGDANQWFPITVLLCRGRPASAPGSRLPRKRSKNSRWTLLCLPFSLFIGFVRVYTRFLFFITLLFFSKGWAHPLRPKTPPKFLEVCNLQIT